MALLRTCFPDLTVAKLMEYIARGKPMSMPECKKKKKNLLVLVGSVSATQGLGRLELYLVLILL